jgi:hypothetical protein
MNKMNKVDKMNNNAIILINNMRDVLDGFFRYIELKHSLCQNSINKNYSEYFKIENHIKRNETEYETDKSDDNDPEKIMIEKEPKREKPSKNKVTTEDVEINWDEICNDAILDDKSLKKKYTISYLKTIAKSLGVSTTGNKALLLENIREKKKKPDDDLNYCTNSTKNLENDFDKKLLLNLNESDNKKIKINKSTKNLANDYNEKYTILSNLLDNIKIIDIKDEDHLYIMDENNVVIGRIEREEYEENKLSKDIENFNILFLKEEHCLKCKMLNLEYDVGDNLDEE